MDLQAFIFCGKGFKLSPFSHTRGDNGVPKAILPIANRPMIEYVLDWCDQANFNEINIVVDSVDVDEIREGVQPFLTRRNQQLDILSRNLSSHHSHYVRKPSPVNFIGSKCESTGESLQKELLERINGDFVLLPCDFITDIPPQIFIDQYRNKDDENLAMAVYYHNTFENIDKKHLKQFFTVFSDNEDSTNQPVLLDTYSKDDIDKTKYLQIRAQLLWRYPNATVSTKLLNSFIYFCSYELAQLLSQQDSRTQSEAESDDSEDEDSSKFKQMSIQPTYFKKKNKLVKDPLTCNKSLAKIFRDLGRRSWQHSKTRETVGIFILPTVGSFIRSNNLSTYMEANRYILKIKSSSMLSQTASTTGPASAIGADSVVGANSTILEKTNIKRSVLGKNCKVGKRCRIVGSIILDGVEIDDETGLENVIIGKFGKIGKKCKLTNCYVEGTYSVSAKSVLKGETLTNIYLDSDEFSEDALETNSEEDSSDYTDEYYEDDEFEDDGLFER